jgi:HSP20 family protein
MARLQVYDPFSTTAGIDELFRGFFAPVRRGDSEAPQAIRLDVTENDQGYVVRAEVPGVNKDDIHVTIEANQVTIASEVKRESEKRDGERVIHTERFADRCSAASRCRPSSTRRRARRSTRTACWSSSSRRSRSSPAAS